MRRITTFVLFLVLCMSNCTILRPKPKPTYAPYSNFVSPHPVVVKSSTQVIPIDTTRPQIKTVYVYQTIPDKNYYKTVDSILNRRMSMYADSNRSFIGSQALVLSDYKAVLINNVKLIDSLKKVRQEKTVLKKENKQQEKTIQTMNNLDYYVASLLWSVILLMLIFGLIKQSRIKREIIQELRATT